MSFVVSVRNASELVSLVLLKVSSVVKKLQAYYLLLLLVVGILLVQVIVHVKEQRMFVAIFVELCLVLTWVMLLWKDGVKNEVMNYWKPKENCVVIHVAVQHVVAGYDEAVDLALELVEYLVAVIFVVVFFFVDLLIALVIAILESFECDPK